MSDSAHEIPERRFQAAGQFYGYSLQITRMLHWLLKADSRDGVSLEVLDDVGVHSDEGRGVVEQDKSAKQNPLTDTSVSLWKTLANWADLVRTRKLDPRNVEFVLFVAQQHAPKEVARSFDHARTAEQAVSALEAARNLLWGEAPHYPKRAQQGSELNKQLDHIFGPALDAAPLVVQRLRISVGSGAPNDELKELLQNKLVAESLIDDALSHCLGWVKRQVDHLIEEGRPPIVRVREFHTFLRGYLRKYDRGGLVSVPLKPEEDVVQRELARRTYIRQLTLIELGLEHKVRAVADYMRAAADRTRWSKSGEVLEESFDEFQEELLTRWELQRLRADAGATSHEVKRGQTVFAECCSLQLEVQPAMPAPPPFVRGSLHRLAEDRLVGWHPRYADLLDKEDGENKR